MIPTTVVTGTLGAGKTTIIRNLVNQLPVDYSVMWLKNEYGDINVDSELAKSSHIKTTEILNGCLCCVLVGKLYDALLEITKNNPALDRLIIETAGTAYPFPIIHEIEKVTSLKLDGLIKVIDVLNFQELEDKSILARQQAQYVDLIVYNKFEMVEPQVFDQVEDEVFDVYMETPKVKAPKGFLPITVAFGIDRKTFIATEDYSELHSHDNHEHVESFGFETDFNLLPESVEAIIKDLSPDEFIRIKGILKTPSGAKLLNWVTGRITLEDLQNYQGKSKLSFIGKKIIGYKDKILDALNRAARK